MGYYAGMSPCGICNRVFTFNPERVPCFPVVLSNPPGLMTRLRTTGSQQPVCKDCFDAINALRKEHNLPPQVAMPDAWGSTEAL